MTKTPDSKPPSLTASFTAATDPWAYEEIVRIKRELLAYEKIGAKLPPAFLREQAYLLSKNTLSGREIETALEEATKKEPGARHVLFEMIDPAKRKLFNELQPEANAFLDAMAEYRAKFRIYEHNGFTPAEIAEMPSMKIVPAPTVAETIKAHAEQQGTPMLAPAEADQWSRNDCWEVVQKVLKDDVTLAVAEEQFQKFWSARQSGKEGAVHHLHDLLDTQKLQYYKDPAHVTALTSDTHLAPNPHRPPIPYHDRDAHTPAPAPAQSSKRKPPPAPSSRKK